jgi:hypothetical protein
MALYVSSPDAVVAGVAVLALTQSIQFDEILPIATKHGLDQVDPEKWYSEQKLLDFLKDLETSPNTSANFVSIGIKVFETMPMPPEINSLEVFLRALPSMLEMMSRNTVGIQTKVGNHTAIVSNTSPYPDDIVYGELWGVAKRFSPDNFTVKPLPKTTFDAVTQYEVTW